MLTGCTAAAAHFAPPTSIPITVSWHSTPNPVDDPWGHPCTRPTPHAPRPTPHEFGTRVHDTKDLQHGWTADLGVRQVAPKKELLEALPFGVRVLSGEWWESLSACPIIPEWCHVVLDYTTLGLYRTKESVFLRGAASPSPYISLAAPVFSHEPPAHDLELDESLCDLGLRVVRGAVEAKECENWYRVLVDSCSTKLDAIWDLLSDAHSGEEFLANAKLPRRWGTRPGKLTSVL